jgi:hypothetical protein
MGQPRGWQQLIPPEHREVFERAGFGRRQEWGTHPALIVVDVCASFLEPTPRPSRRERTARHLSRSL